jgi:hypothetical protein
MLTTLILENNAILVAENGENCHHNNDLLVCGVCFNKVIRAM